MKTSEFLLTKQIEILEILQEIVDKMPNGEQKSMACTGWVAQICSAVGSPNMSGCSMAHSVSEFMSNND